MGLPAATACWFRPACLRDPCEQVWDLSRLGGDLAAALPTVPQQAQQAAPRLVSSLSPPLSGASGSGQGALAGIPRPPGEQEQGPVGQAQQAQQGPPSWPSPSAQGQGAAQQRRSPAGASSAAAASLDCLLGSNEAHLRRGLPMG